jgi:hypothetical protein
MSDEHMMMMNHHHINPSTNENVLAFVHPSVLAKSAKLAAVPLAKVSHLSVGTVG